MGDFIDMVKNAPISGSPEHKGAIAVKDEKQRANLLKELNDLRDRQKEGVKGTIEVFSKYYDKKDRNNHYESNQKELQLIEKLDPTLKKIYKEKPEVKQRIREINQESRILRAIEEKKFPIPVTEKWPARDQEERIGEKKI